MNAGDSPALPTAADGMLALAKIVGSTNCRFTLAKRFHDRGPAFALRALVEGWDLDRIIKELY